MLYYDTEVYLFIQHHSKRDESIRSFESNTFVLKFPEEKHAFCVYI